MMARRLFLGSLAALLAGCGGKVQTWTVRYRLTLDVETPEGVKSGSSVIENRWTRDDNAIPRASVYAKDRGEAVVVDLGARGLLFALLCERSGKGSPGSSADYAHYLPIRVFERTGALKYSAQGERGAEAAQLSSMRTSAELTTSEIPFLVRFRDIADPKSVEAVDPNDLAKSFGPGVKLLRAMVEMTSDPVTTGIEGRLGWLSRLGDNHQLDGDRYWRADAPNRVANALNILNFKQESN